MMMLWMRICVLIKKKFDFLNNNNKKESKI